MGIERAKEMMKLSRRRFLAVTAAAGAAKAVPAGLARLPLAPAKRVLELVYDKALGAMRAIDRLL